MLFPTCQHPPFLQVVTTLVPVLRVCAELVTKQGKDYLNIKATDYAQEVLCIKVTPYFF